VLSLFVVASQDPGPSFFVACPLCCLLLSVSCCSCCSCWLLVAQSGAGSSAAKARAEHDLRHRLAGLFAPL
jgi:hypothetical protein